MTWQKTDLWYEESQLAHRELVQASKQCQQEVRYPAQTRLRHQLLFPEQRDQHDIGVGAQEGEILANASYLVSAGRRRLACQYEEEQIYVAEDSSNTHSWPLEAGMHSKFRGRREKARE